MPRSAEPGSRRFPVTAKLSKDELDRIDAARGEISRSEFVRSAALAAGGSASTPADGTVSR